MASCYKNTWLWYEDIDVQLGDFGIHISLGHQLEGMQSARWDMPGQQCGTRWIHRTRNTVVMVTMTIFTDDLTDDVPRMTRSTLYGLIWRSLKVFNDPAYHYHNDINNMLGF